MPITSLRFIAVSLCLALPFASPSSAQTSAFILAQAQPAQPAEKADTTRRRIDEIAEVGRALSGPAANPECVWLGRRVVSLLWRDDLDTAFRHLDLYDRFGCPGGHIQATFRCVLRHGDIDPKAPETLSNRVLSCWINPALQPSPAAAAAPAAGPQPPAANR